MPTCERSRHTAHGAPRPNGWRTPWPRRSSSPGGISLSPDGITWQKIEIFLPEPTTNGGGGSSMFGNTMILSMFETGGKRVMWIGRVEPS
jgi:hypothetical protein